MTDRIPWIQPNGGSRNALRRVFACKALHAIQKKWESRLTGGMEKRYSDTVLEMDCPTSGISEVQQA